MRLQTSAILAAAALSACVPPDPFVPEFTCHVSDEQGRELFGGIRLEEDRRCDPLEFEARQLRDLLVRTGFTTREDFPALVAGVKVWIHEGARTREGDVVTGRAESIGVYSPSSRTGEAPWIELERWRLSWSHEVLHHIDVAWLGVDPREELKHERWKLADPMDPDANPYVVASDVWYWQRWAERERAGF